VQCHVTLEGASRLLRLKPRLIGRTL